MKAIMISDKPKWCALMMNGVKNIEVRTSKALATAIQKLIDKYGFAEIYVYCSKYGGWLTRYKENNGSKYCWYNKENYNLNGKVVFKFRCYKVEELELKMLEGGLYFAKPDKEVIEIDLNEEAQLDNFELLHYTGTKLGTKIFAIHISDLEIFDKPKELSEFKIPCDFKCPKLGCCYCHKNTRLTKAPQSWCYIETED